MHDVDIEYRGHRIQASHEDAKRGLITLYYDIRTKRGVKLAADAVSDVENLAAGVEMLKSWVDSALDGTGEDNCIHEGLTPLQRANLQRWHGKNGIQIGYRRERDPILRGTRFAA